MAALPLTAGLHHRSDLAVDDLVRWIRPVVSGWIHYYGRFYPSAIRHVLLTLDAFLVRWAQRKCKRFKGSTLRAWAWFERLKRRQPSRLPHWPLAPTAGR